MVSGLWHGANWTFLLWGSLHGFYLIVSIWTKEIRDKIADFTRLSHYPTLHKWYKIFITFHLVLFSWVFFRANSISDALLILKRIFFFNHLHMETVTPMSSLGITIAISIILLMEIIHILQSRINIYEFVTNRKTIVRWAVYSCFIFLIILLGNLSSEVDFIYFQF